MRKRIVKRAEIRNQHEKLIHWSWTVFENKKIGRKSIFENLIFWYSNVEYPLILTSRVIHFFTPKIFIILLDVKTLELVSLFLVGIFLVNDMFLENPSKPFMHTVIFVSSVNAFIFNNIENVEHWWWNSLSTYWNTTHNNIGLHTRITKWRATKFIVRE